ncbi:hypothetical protein LZ30DRAFT_728137 [Colletotrichum cereale]|nr:hypothetical protein LZ30DRAFT_728137 [Colletotrichum cereale]
MEGRCVRSGSALSSFFGYSFVFFFLDCFALCLSLEFSGIVVRVKVKFNRFRYRLRCPMLCLGFRTTRAYPDWLLPISFCPPPRDQ